MCDFSEYGGPSDEWLAVAASIPAPVPGLSLDERKKIINDARDEGAAEAMKAMNLGPQVRMQDHAIPARDGSSLEARSYRPAGADQTRPLPVYLHLHGGGFFFGTLASEDFMCARIAANDKVVVLNVNYRHTPEYPYPTAWDDTHDAFEWLHDHIDVLGGDAGQVVIGGISAGAQLAASLTLEQHLGRIATGRPAIAGQLLMIPALVNMDCYEPQLKQMKNPAVSSCVENRDAPILPMAIVKFFTDLLKIENPDVNDLKLSPGNATPAQVKGLPPTVFGITGLDPLRDEGLLYAKMLTEAG